MSKDEQAGHIGEANKKLVRNVASKLIKHFEKLTIPIRRHHLWLAKNLYEYGAAEAIVDSLETECNIMITTCANVLANLLMEMPPEVRSEIGQQWCLHIGKMMVAKIKMNQDSVDA